MSQVIQEYLNRAIPVTRALGVTVADVSDDQVVLTAPLLPNLNHESNAFGGSISAVAILAGWTFLYWRLRGVTEARSIVIQRSNVEYLRPIQSEFVARCTAPSTDEWQRFDKMLTRWGRGRIMLDVEVMAEGATAARFRGTYVAATAPVS